MPVNSNFCALHSLNLTSVTGLSPVGRLLALRTRIATGVPLVGDGSLRLLRIRTRSLPMAAHKTQRIRVRRASSNESYFSSKLSARAHRETRRSRPETSGRIKAKTLLLVFDCVGGRKVYEMGKALRAFFRLLLPLLRLSGCRRQKKALKALPIP